MLSIFKINDPYRILLVFIIALAIQLPILISGINISIAEIEWQTLGNKMSSGGALYVDVYYPIGPLSAQVYRLLSYVASDNYFIYRILGLIMVIVQAMIFNVVLIRHKAFNQNTYVPSLMYVVLMMGMEDYVTLSPQLMGLTFVLLTSGLTFKLIEGRRRNDEDFLKIGLFTGFSILFYPLYLFFLFPVIIALLFFTNSAIRRYLLLLTGIFIPLLLTWFKFYWYGQLRELYFNLDFLFMPGNDFSLLTWKDLLLILVIPLFFLLYSFFRILQSTSFINYQVRLQKYYFQYLTFGILIILFDYHLASHILIVFVPVMAFFISHLFLMIRKTFYSEVLFLSFLAFTVSLNYSTSFEWIKGGRIVNFPDQYLRSYNQADPPARGKVLVVGMDTRKYYKNDLATPYLSWAMLEQQVQSIQYYNNIVTVYENFNDDLPEVIFDEASVMPVILSRIPELSSKYRKNGNRTYQLIPSNR